MTCPAPVLAVLSMFTTPPVLVDVLNVVAGRRARTSVNVCIALHVCPATMRA